MVFAEGPDSLLTCPLDKSHRILKSRMQYHLVRCLKNHNLGMRLKCPWNPLHIIDKFAYEDHYKRECEDMPAALDFICQTEGTCDVGSVPVTATNGILPPAEEDWDAEPGPAGTYDPFKNAEGKPVLRCAVGLSKAKKKAWRQAERRRFQALEEAGPIQNPLRPLEKPDVPKELRPPRNIGMALSTDTSMIEEFNSLKISKDDKKSGKDKSNSQKLRIPHERSPALTYKANLPNSGHGAHRKRIPRGSDKSISSDDESRIGDEVPNLCQMSISSYHDTLSRRSSVSSHSNIEALRKTLEKSIRITNISNSILCASEAENSALLDEAACLPKLIAPIVTAQDDTVFALSQRLAELTTEQKKLDGIKADLIRKMSLYDQLPKLVSSTVSHSPLNRHDRKHDDGKFNGSISSKEDSLPAKHQSSFHNGNPKCAANFPKLRNANVPTVGIGRGMVIALDSFENKKPGPSKGEIEVGLNTTQGSPDKDTTNPFLMPERMSAGNTSYRTYTLSTASVDEEDSVYGYEEAA